MCGSCNKTKCVCKKVVDTCYQDGCEEKYDSKCVIYKPKGTVGTSACNDKLKVKTPIETVVENFNTRICSLETNTATTDQLVKVTSNDSTAGYLWDKITVSNCIVKTLVNNAGVQTINLSIDYACLQANLPQCLTVNIP